jgi:hypothetical protein
VSSFTGVGLVAGGVVALNGIDQIVAGARQITSNKRVDSFTSQGLQGVGLSRNAANLTDAAIGVVGSVGTGVATAVIIVSTVRATEAGAKGLSFSKVREIIDEGARALNNADYTALGGISTSNFLKGGLIRAGVDAAGRRYQLTTTVLQRAGKAIYLALTTGFTAGGNAFGGAVGAGALGVAAASCRGGSSLCLEE